MKKENQKPLFEAGFQFTKKEGSTSTLYTVKKVRCISEYPSGEFVEFRYVVEHVITFKDGRKTVPFRFVKSGEGVLELMEPAARQWYSFSVEG